MSVFKDTTVLAKQTVKMIGQLLKGKQVDVNDTETFDNGAKVVPAFLCTPLAVTKKNYKKLLIDGASIARTCSSDERICIYLVICSF